MIIPVPCISRGSNADLRRSPRRAVATQCLPTSMRRHFWHFCISRVCRQERGTPLPMLSASVFSPQLAVPSPRCRRHDLSSPRRPSPPLAVPRRPHAVASCRLAVPSPCPRLLYARATTSSSGRSSLRVSGVVASSQRKRSSNCLSSASDSAGRKLLRLPQRNVT